VDEKCALGRRLDFCLLIATLSGTR
jgi:hypothetical protein